MTCISKAGSATTYASVAGSGEQENLFHFQPEGFSAAPRNFATCYKYYRQYLFKSEENQRRSMFLKFDNNNNWDF